LLKKTAFIAPFTWIGISNPLINSAIFLAQMGYQVDIYAIYDKINANKGINNFDFNNKKINVFLLKKKFLLKIKSKIDGNIFSHFRSSIDGNQYRVLFAFDLDGLRIAADITKKTKNKYIFFSLEIEKSHQLSSKDRMNANNAFMTITQSESRRRELSKLYNIPISNINILPNSCFGPTINEKKNYFSELFKLEKDVKIILCLGTLSADHCVDKIIESISNLPPKYCLVLHGWFVDDETENTYNIYKNKYPNNIFHSDIILLNNDLIYQSCDFGVIAYNPISTNLKYAIGSSGKMFEFFKNGVPLIVNDIPDAKDMIQTKGCGLVANNFNSISTLLYDLDSNYKSYQKNCYSQFSLNQFDHQFSYLINNTALKKLL